MLSKPKWLGNLQSHDETHGTESSSSVSGSQSLGGVLSITSDLGSDLRGDRSSTVLDRRGDLSGLRLSLGSLLSSLRLNRGGLVGDLRASSGNDGSNTILDGGSNVLGLRSMSLLSRSSNSLNLSNGTSQGLVLGVILGWPGFGEPLWDGGRLEGGWKDGAEVAGDLGGGSGRHDWGLDRLDDVGWEVLLGQLVEGGLEDVLGLGGGAEGQDGSGGVCGELHFDGFCGVLRLVIRGRGVYCSEES